MPLHHNVDKLWEAGKLGRCPDLGLTAKLMFDQTKPKIKPHLLQLGEAVGEPSTYLMGLAVRPHADSHHCRVEN